ncbi:hypothetical protein Taro_037819, partial [Colocasia esculenta]|nr:hypothetical protein [Colocasia esculenta]
MPNSGRVAWLATPLTNLDKHTGLPLSLAATDKRSSCHSTKPNKNCGDQPNHHTYSRTTTLLESEGVQENNKTLT